MKDVDNVRVVVRCRPLNEKEVQQGCKLSVQVCFLLIEKKKVYNMSGYLL
jgi:hypothetical protein